MHIPLHSSISPTHLHRRGCFLPTDGEDEGDGGQALSGAAGHLLALPGAYLQTHLPGSMALVLQREAEASSTLTVLAHLLCDGSGEKHSELVCLQQFRSSFHSVAATTHLLLHLQVIHKEGVIVPAPSERHLRACVCVWGQCEKGDAVLYACACGMIKLH